MPLISSTRSVLLTDPAFSPDPRANPHFHASPSPSPPQSAVQHRASPTHYHPSPPPSPSSTLLIPIPIPIPIPRSPPPRSTLSRILPKSLSPQNNGPPRKSRMKALVRRLTGRRNLDCIDELDETDPFGASYHHDGPYEAIAHNVAHPTLSFPDPDPLFPGTNSPHPMPEFDPRSLRFGQHRPNPQVPYAEMGLSLHLEPGQILQPNSIFSSHTSNLAPVPIRPGIATRVARPDHSRSHSLPKPWTRSSEDSSSLDLLGGSQNRPTSLQTPRGRHFTVITPDIPNDLRPHHDRNAAPYALRQTEISVFPPPRYESRFHSPAPPRLPQHIPPPTNSPDTQSVQSTLSHHDSRHNDVHSFDKSHAIKDIITQSSSSIRDKPSDFSRMRHVPKRLVMPSPLQPQQPQSYHNVSSLKPEARLDERPDDRDLEVAHLTGKPPVQFQEPRVLQKKLSTFPAKKRIPDHVPTLQDAVVPITGNFASKMATDAVETKERTRRRKLSKRKSDI